MTLSEFTKDAKWQADLMRVEKISSGPVALGSTGQQVAKFLGQKMQDDVLVTGFEPHRRFALRTTDACVPRSGLAPSARQEPAGLMVLSSLRDARPTETLGCRRLRIDQSAECGL